MKPLGSISLKAGLLQEALAVVVPLPRAKRLKFKPWPITIALDTKRSRLEISEATYALKSFSVEASGYWPERVQLDGRSFARS